MADDVDSLQENGLVARYAHQLVLQHVDLVKVLLLIYRVLVLLCEDVDLEPLLEEQ